MKKGILLALSGALLISGSALLIQQAKLFLNVDKGSPQSNSPKLSAHKTQVKDASLDGVVPADAVDNYTFRVDGKDTFNLLLANYKDPQGRQQQAVLFPKGNKQGVTYEPWHWRFVGDQQSLETFYKAKEFKQENPPSPNP